MRKYAEFRYTYYKDNVMKLFFKNYKDFKGIDIRFAKTEDEQRERKVLINTKRKKSHI